MSYKWLLSLIVILSTFSMKAKATDTTYQKQWKEINQLYSDKKLPKSALAKVKTLYAKAKKDNNAPQLIKTLLYQITLNEEIDDNNNATAIKLYTNELKTAKNETVKSLINLLLANAYKAAFDENRWQYKERTDTKDYKAEDYKTWTEKDFRNKVIELTREALSNPSNLQKITLSDFDAVIIKGAEPQLRPSLYDLLLFDAIDILGTFTENEESENQLLLANYNTFIQSNLSAISENTATIFILKLYQDVLAFHAKDKEQDALIDADINRVNWIKQKFNFDEEDYLAAIKSIINYGKNNPVADEAHYLLANLHFEKGGNYDFKKTPEKRFELVEAKKIIDTRLKEQTKKSSGGIHLKNLNNQILNSSLNAQLEKVNVPHLPFRMLVEFKNVDTLYYRIIKLKSLNQINEDEPEEKYWRKLKKITPLVKAEQKLPIVTDYQNHSCEIKIDALPIGEYIILGSNSKEFNDTTNHLFSINFAVSNLSCINSGNDYFVLNRETGQPIENAQIEFVSKDNQSNKKEKETQLGLFKTDKNGFVRISKLPFKEGYTRYYKTVSVGEDVIRDEDSYSSYRNNNQRKINFEEAHCSTIIFTDRGIYRPGQTVFFKTLFTTKDSVTGRSKLFLPKKKVKVLLYDVDYQKVDSVELSVNDFGTANSSFKLPTTGLTGQFHLQVEKYNSDRKYFNVEEYKRPTFSIEFNKIKEAYCLNDSIKVSGLVKAYAGNASNNCVVKYTVKREAQYKPIDYYRRFSNKEKQISFGEIKTTDDGSFEFSFKAEPNNTTKQKTLDDEYNFVVNVTVTDLNGETRNETVSYNIGYKGFDLVHSIAEKNELEKFKQFTVSAKSKFGQKVATNIQLKITALHAPQRLIRERFWNEPDTFVFSQEEYGQHFPYDEYKNETDLKTWTKGNIVFETAINTANTDTVLLPQLPQGNYVIEMVAKDKNNNEIKDETFTELYSNTSNDFATPTFDWNSFLEKNKLYQPNDTATAVLGSSCKDVFVIQQMQLKRGFEKGSKKNEKQYQFTQLNNEKKAWNYIVKEEDKGGFLMNYIFVKHNRVYSASNSFYVPFTEKELQVQLATYRNKTEPGSKETWSVKVKGLNNTKVEAELLSSMYDVALDQFRKNEFESSTFWLSAFNFDENWNKFNDFAEIGSEQNYLYDYNEGEDDKYSSIPKRVAPLWWLNPLRFGNIEKNQDQLELKKGWGGSYGVRGGFMHDMNPDIRYESVSYYNANAPRIEMLKFTPPKIVKDEEVNGDGVTDKMDKEPSNSKPQTPSILPRKNLQETAFFFPAIYADKEGNYTFSFTMPEALTQWRWMNFAHTKDLATGYNEAIITTQKTLMVQPNLPRFLREGDNIELVTKIGNLSEKEITGQCTLELIDATTGNVVDGWFQNGFATQYFTAAAQKNTVVKFPLQVPFNFNKPVTIRIVAKAADFSDGEENTIPVLSNRMLVTETLPLYLKPGEKSKNFSFSKLINNASETLQHQALTVEYTANPIWNVVKSLPYLMEYPYECEEQTFNRLFGNVLAGYIVNQHPKIKTVLNEWLKDTTINHLSTLQQNEALKQALLQETPWVLDAENEAQQQKNIALLYDVAKMSKSIQTTVEKLKQMQLSNGAFPWFKGGNANRYITNYIVTGIGKLKKLNAINNEELDKIATSAIQYLDEQIQQDYASLKKEKVDLNKQHIYSSAIDYLYMKSFYSESNKNSEAYRFYYNQAKNYWQKQNVYYAALIGTVLHRNNERRFVNVNIVPSILENTIEDTTTGTIKWKQQQTCFWYNAPFEHQSTMIAFLQEIYNQEKTSNLPAIIDAAKTWLILNKQTNNWQTTVATAEACYALLSSGNNWVENNQQVNIKLGNKTIDSSSTSGYLKQRIDAENIQSTMGNVQVVVSSNPPSGGKGASFGAVYWQYFEDLDKITVSDTAAPLHLVKKIFKEITTAKGKEIQLINENDELKVGDKIIVRLELSANRTMEYLHLKDMRASGSEPVNVLSGYKWQDGLGYYEATKDASTNFFIDYLPKGTYVMEYSLYISQAGVFSVGIANIQCMYAPEFTSHSEGIKVRVIE